DIKELQEYNRDIHGILGITAEEFNDMRLIEQQAAITALITAQAHCKNEPTKQALYEKHKEFLQSQLEKVGEMHDDTEIQGRIYGDVISARKKKNPQILLPDLEGRSTYKPYEQYDVPRDKQFIKKNKQIGIRIPHSPTDDVFLDERLSQASRRNKDIPQGVLPKVTKFLGDVGQGIKNKFTSRPATPSPLSQHTLSRAPTPTIENNNNVLDQKRNKRGYTPSPDPYERKQQRYKSSSLSSKHTDQISNEEVEEIEIPYYDNVHNEGQSSTYRPVHGTFKGQTYTTYVSKTIYQELEELKEEELSELEAQLEADLEEHRIERFGQEVEIDEKETIGYDPEFFSSTKLGETEKERIKILQERCGNKVWKILGDVLTEYVDEFREKQEMGTSVNKNIIPDIQFILNKNEHEIPDNNKNQGIRKYTIEEEKNY
ncbi:10137_t:CDS:2, partial [Dentiscutata erythropus]